MSKDDATHVAAYRDRFDNQVLKDRLKKLDSIREAGRQPFDNGLAPTHAAAELFAAHAEDSKEALEGMAVEVAVAGRIRFFNRKGKIAFVHVQDRTCRPGVKPAWDGKEPTHDFLQLFISKGAVGEDAYEHVKALDLGDIVWARGVMMRTNTGELSVGVQELRLLTKNTRPLPEKFKGLTDIEQRYRQRYVDLIMNDAAREVFFARASCVQYIRRFFEDRGFLDVETPILHPMAGGAAARPFETHHNALDMPLFLRIAPELYLKRLLVGGFERVFEMNRNFRNEGVSTQHNPEFTMLEFYQAYATYEEMIALTEELVSGLAEKLHGRQEDGRVVSMYGDIELDWTAPWRRVRVTEAVATRTGMDEDGVWEREALERWLIDEASPGAQSVLKRSAKESWSTGKLLFSVFEEFCESELVQPTFLVDFPVDVSPLSRRKDSDGRLADRFELYIAGREIANGFSELNDPEDQYVRFAKQLEAREAGDDEAMPLDEDYVRALEYGMPPAGGEGIGIDRLVMMLTNASSIRDVILFPHMRPEQTSA